MIFVPKVREHYEEVPKAKILSISLKPKMGKTK